jgi:trimeric autotransporter adhesin
MTIRIELAANPAARRLKQGAARALGALGGIGARSALGALGALGALARRAAFGAALATAAAAAIAPAIAFAASPPAGTAIGNQASATYTDASNAARSVTSNVVTAIVQQVGSLTLTQNTAKPVTAGSQVAYPVTLTNTGNGTDTFNLAFTQSGAFAFSSVVFYADANGDGVADNTTPITASTALAQGEVFRFVAVGTVPPTAAAGSSNSLVITAASTFAAGVNASVTESTSVTANAVVNTTKTMSATSGNPGSGPFTVTLTYSNTGNSTATNVLIKDPLPAGLAYVAGSARWSGTGATVLTDANAADAQGSGPTVVYDFGVTAANQATALVSAVAPGQSGTVAFQVTIAPFDTATATGQLAGAINNTASTAYNDGAADVGPFPTNTFAFTVNAVKAVAMTGATVASATQGSTVSFTNVVKNNGNSADSFDITLAAGTFPVGTSYALYQADGVTPLLDTNGNGVPDTGAVASGATYNVVLKVTLPTAATGGPYGVGKTATSKLDPTKSATVTDTLTAISANAVDLTNNAAIGGGGVVGTGAGPEAGAQVTNSTNPGTTTRFTLYVNNTATVADTFDLAASTNAAFGTLTLPAGWTVVFRDSAGTVITNTGVVNGGTNKLVFADVSVPANQAAVPAPGQDLYFRVLSPSSGAVDRIHDAVVVATVRSVQVTPNNNGQVFPGGSVVYTHTLTNAGNVVENSGPSTLALALADTQGTFSSIVYRDANNNGVIDVGDVIVNAPSDLGPVAPGASVRLLVKVSAASGAAVGIIDTTTLSVTTAGAVNGTAAPAAVSASDSTSVIAGNLVLLKEQALDAACDGVADTAFSTANITAGAVPGACVRYRITITNIGAADVLSVVLSDATPANTTYHAVVPAAATQGAVSTPTAGSAGTLSANVGTLTPTASAVLTFGVRINP